MSKYIISRKSLESYVDFLRQATADASHMAAVRGNPYFAGRASGFSEAASRLESAWHLADVEESDDA